MTTLKLAKLFYKILKKHLTYPTLNLSEVEARSEEDTFYFNDEVEIKFKIFF